MIKINIILFFFFSIFANFVFSPTEDSIPSKKVEQIFRQKLAGTLTKLTELQEIATDHPNDNDLQRGFKQLRLSYKQSEALIAYYYPSLARIINGPALPFADGENSMGILEPQGMQVMEEILFQPVKKRNIPELKRQIQKLQSTLSGILYQHDPYQFQDKYIFDAICLEMYRLIALGISGFDSQTALYSMPEAASVIESLKQIIDIYLAVIKDHVLAKQMNDQLVAAATYLKIHPDFDRFNRLYFVTVYANPLSEKILKLEHKLGYTIPKERRMLSPLAPHLFATDYFSPEGYSPNEEANPTPDKIVLGEKLFYDPVLSANHQRSCATCHQPAKAFTDGLPRSLALDDVNTVARNAPTLWNAAFQPLQFYDSRAVFMEDQVFNVVHNDREMGGSLQQVVLELRKDSEYIKLFNKAYASSDSALQQENITNAIASFLRSLVGLHSRFDQFMNGNRATLNEDEKNGFNLFMGKAKCATCHFVPLFNGVAPPYFGEVESEVLGVPATNDSLHPLLDKDVGKYGLYPISILKYSFKTPTLRNIELTAPYMHNGVYRTLDEVIDFYDKGGGAGLGIAPPNQTLPSGRLKLTGKEKKQLIAFLKTLTDTVRVIQINNSRSSSRGF